MKNDSLTMADLQKAWDLLKSMPPAPVKIWCINRPADYYRIKQACYSIDLSTIDTLTGLPVIDWQSSGFDPESAIIAGKEDTLNKLRLDNHPKRVYPWICNYPGVWIEWSNGKFTEVKFAGLKDDSPAVGPAAT